MGIHIQTQKKVAIKILKENDVLSRLKSLECFFNEVNILTHCDHPNVAKIIEAQFNGTITKQHQNENTSLSFKEKESNDDSVQVKEYVESVNICYCVMKLAELGELYQFIEHTDRFSEKFSRSLYL